MHFELEWPACGGGVQYWLSAHCDAPALCELEVYVPLAATNTFYVAGGRDSIELHME